MIRLTRSHIQPVGVDIGRDAVKMVQVEASGESLTVIAASRRPFEGAAQDKPRERLSVAPRLVRRMLGEDGFRGRRVVVSLPREFLHVKNFRLPLMPPEEMAPAMRFEARSVFPFDIEEAEVQFIPAGEVRQGNDTLQEVIALAARSEDVDPFVEQFHRAGVAVESLDAEHCALFRSVERFVRRKEDEHEVYVLADVGQGGTHVVIGKGRDISFVKTIELGGLHFQDAVSKKLGIPMQEARALRRRLIDAPETAEKRDPVRQAVFDATRSVMEQLGKELSLCLRYQSVTFRGCRPTKLRLLGGEGADPALVNVLASAVSIPVETGRPMFSLDLSRLRPEQRQGPMGEWALALGLSLRHTSGRYRPRDGRPREAIGVAAAGETDSSNNPHPRPLPEYRERGKEEHREKGKEENREAAAVAPSQEGPHA